MSNSNIGLQRLKTFTRVRRHLHAHQETVKLYVLGTRRKWPRPRRDRDVDDFSRDETETRRWYVSRPSRDRYVETETTTLPLSSLFLFLPFLYLARTTSYPGHAVKEPGHFEVRKSSSQVTQMLFFLKKVDDLFSCRPENTGRQRRQNKTNKAVRYGNIFIFCSHAITEAKQYAGLGRAERGLEPGRWIFQPGHLAWRALV